MGTLCTYNHIPFKRVASSLCNISARSTAVLLTTSGAFVHWVGTKKSQGHSQDFKSSTSCSVAIFSWYSVDSTTWTWQTLLNHLYESTQHNLVFWVWGRHVLLQVTVHRMCNDCWSHQEPMHSVTKGAWNCNHQCREDNKIITILTYLPT